MIQNWVEISVDLFREIFESYVSHRGNSTEKVIEIQNPAEIYFGTNARTFIGAGLDPFEFRSFNEVMCKTCEMLEKGGDLGDSASLREDIKILNSCDIPKYIAGPLISPVGATPENLKLWWTIHFGSLSDMEKISTVKDKIDDFKAGISWYFRNKNGKIVYDMRRENNIDEKDMLIRIRSIDLADWKKMVYETISINEFPAEYMKEDMKKEDFFMVLEK